MWGSMKADRSCNKRFPTAGQMVLQYEPWHWPTGRRMTPIGFLHENTHRRQHMTNDDVCGCISVITGHYNIQNMISKDCIYVPV